MTLEDLITLYRAEAMDDVVPYFCEDDLLTIYANEAQDEACRRAELIMDSYSPMCTLAFAAGDISIALDAKVLQVLRASVDGRPVDIVSVDEMDAVHPGWALSGALGTPLRLVSGMTTGRLHFHPHPANAGTVRMSVHRLPLKPLRLESDKPEIRPELHQALVHWMLYRACSRQDADRSDSTKAAVALSLFEAEFGRKASGRNEQWVRNGADLQPGPIC